MPTSEFAVGDFVICVRRGKPVFGIVETTAPLQSLVSNGFLHSHSANEIWFRVPAMFAGPAGTTDLHGALRSLSMGANAFRQSHLDRLHAAYDEFHLQRGLAEVDLLEFIRWVFAPHGAAATAPKLDVAHAAAVILHLAEDQVHYTPAFSSLHQNLVVRMRPARVVRLLQRAHAMLTSALNGKASGAPDPFAAFVAKCRLLLDHTNPVEPWSEEDAVLLECLRIMALDSTPGSLGPFRFLETNVLQNLGYTAQAREPALRLLIDLGIFHRHDNFALFTSPLKLERSGFPEVDAALAKAHTDATALASTMPVLDGLDSVRHDFGSLPVYTIDDPSAQEIDDGVSVEYGAAGEPEWVHIHVADPTAYLDLNNSLVAWAQARMQTVYFPESTYSMLPSSLAAGRFSLAGAGPVRALTVSIRLDAAGEIADCKVQPSILHSVTPRPYELVDSVLDTNFPGVIRPPIAPRVVSSVTPGADVTIAERTASRMSPTAAAWPGGPLTEVQTRDLRALQCIARRHAERRYAAGGFNASNWRPMVSVTPAPGTAFPSTVRDNVHPARRPEGLAAAPEIRLHRDLIALSPSRQVIAELMIMAGRATAQFASEHKVAVPFRSQRVPSAEALGALPWHAADVLTAFTSRMKPSSVLSLPDTLASAGVLSAAENAVTPGPHYQMGITHESGGYTKATSPLRRFTDMLGHFQLKAALRAAHGLPGAKPMAGDDLAPWLAAARPRERAIRTAQRAREAWWAAECLRLRHAAEPAAVYVARVHRNLDRFPRTLGIDNTLGTSGAVLGLVDAGVRGVVQLPVGTPSLEIGEWVTVRVRTVDPIGDLLVLELVERMALDPHAE
ncbi:3'-5' RNA exonuclease complex component [Blastocladiella emersonii ATCC 22665]|nr:3'-5' RNA exonuclease complex component [Blastocladiella emersonii ATCC 22665]